MVMPAALALLAGAVACLCLPALPGSGWFVAASIVGAGGALASRWWGGSPLRFVAIMAFGFGACGLHASAALSTRLPPAFEGHDLRISGRVVELPVVEERRVRFLFQVDADAAQHDAMRGKRLRLA